MTTEALERAITPGHQWCCQLALETRPAPAVYTLKMLKKLTDVLLRHPQVYVMLTTCTRHGVRRFRVNEPAAREVEPRSTSDTLTRNASSKAYCMTAGAAAMPAGRSRMIKAHGER